MKPPTLLLEWDCDGIGCTRRVQIVVPGDVSIPCLTDAAIENLAIAGGGRMLGRNTFFCPACADPRRNAPPSLTPGGREPLAPNTEAAV